MKKVKKRVILFVIGIGVEWIFWGLGLFINSSLIDFFCIYGVMMVIRINVIKNESVFFIISLVMVSFFKDFEVF